MRQNAILVVDDDKVTLDLLREVFEKENYTVTSAGSAEAALELMKTESFPLVLSDIRMLGIDGIELLQRIKKDSPSSVVILMTGFGNLDGAVRAIQEGAFDYISKPFRIQDLKSLVARAQKQWVMSREQGMAPLRKENPSKRSLIGKSPMIVEVYKNLAKASLSSSSILIKGESGTGKELVARAIHENSPRKEKKFVAINCGSLTETLLESELFGHIKGSFTGAISDKPGILEEANGGTLFLDEIGDISAGLQVKLLRVLQDGEYKPVGSNTVKKTDLRVIAATHRNLEDMIQKGTFRDDLYYRLKVIEIQLPPLRDRMEDMPDLVNHFLAHYSEANKKRISHVSPEALEMLKKYAWPGNIRELEHAIERAVAMCGSQILFPEDFPSIHPAVGSGAEAAPTNASTQGARSGSLEDMEKEHIIRVLKETNFNKSKASALLGIDRATLYRKAQRYGISLVRP